MQEEKLSYRKLHGGTVVGFHQGFIDIEGSPSEVRLDRENCLVAIENTKANRAGFATEAMFQKRLAAYEGAARFMGWLE